MLHCSLRGRLNKQLRYRTGKPASVFSDLKCSIRSSVRSSRSSSLVGRKKTCSELGWPHRLKFFKLMARAEFVITWLSFVIFAFCLTYFLFSGSSLCMRQGFTMQYPAASDLGFSCLGFLSPGISVLCHLA